MTPEYSIVVPVYNSELTLFELFNRTNAIFAKLGFSFEMVFVDDFSRDNSWDVLVNLKQQHKEKVTAIKLAKNFGQHNAVFCGLEHAKGSLIITIDDDLQVSPEEMPKLIEEHKKTDADLVYGFYGKKKHSLFRNFGSYFIKKSSSILLNSPGEGSSFRLITANLANQIRKHSQHFMYIDELFLWYTGNIAFTEVAHHKRAVHRSGYSNWKLFKLSANIVIYYTAVPLKIMTLGGFAMSILSLLLGLRFIYQKLMNNVPLGYTSLIVTILFSTSIIMLCLGLIGEYLSRIYQVQNKKPPYSIKNLL